MRIVPSSGQKLTQATCSSTAVIQINAYMSKPLELTLKFARFGGTVELVVVMRKIIPHNPVYLDYWVSGLTSYNTYQFSLPAATNVFQKTSEFQS